LKEEALDRTVWWTRFGWSYGSVTGEITQWMNEEACIVPKNRLNLYHFIYIRRSQWPRCLRRRSAAQRLLGSCVRILPGTWIFFSCTVFVLSGRGLCDGPILRPEESYYRLWSVPECDQVKINNLDAYCE
jgi:hypothetical protein